MTPANAELDTLLTFEIQTLTFKLMPKIDDALKADVVKWSAFYEHRIRMGSVRIKSGHLVLKKYPLTAL